MAKIICLNVNHFIQVEDGKDLEEVAMSFERGVSGALDHFPDGDVFQSDIEASRVLETEEIEERGFEEG